MLKITRKYEDFDGHEREEDFYFNLTKAELAEFRFSVNGGVEALLDGMIKAQDQKSMIEYAKRLVLMSYGEKSLDGREMLKNDAIREKFMSTQAYSDIFMDVATNDKFAADFIKGILPKDLAGELDKEMTSGNVVPMA